MIDSHPPADPPPPLPLAVRVGPRTNARALPIAVRVVRPRSTVERPSRAGANATSIVPLMLTMGVFTAMMFVSFGHLAYIFLQSADTLPTEEDLRWELLRDSAILEGLDTVLVLAGLFVAGLPKARRVDVSPIYAWALAAPTLVLFLGLNIGYTLVLRWFVQPDPEDLPISIDLTDGWWAILLVCVQPAVVEELFFRYLLFGHLRRHLGVHATVWLSGVVFGMAHIGNIAGWPVLIVLGAGLGYARAYSNGLLLPIGLHFFHNLAVLAAGEVLDG